MGNNSPDVLVREVGLRDGLQMIPAFVETEHKAAWCLGLAHAGVSEIEATSFAPPDRLPQFADAETVLAAANAIPGLGVTVLAPNLRGAQRALAAGARSITFIVTASEAFSQANLRRPIAVSLGELQDLVALRPKGVRIIAGLSSALGCAMEGAVSLAQVRRLAGEMARAGADEIVIADTVGYGVPSSVKSTFDALKRDLGKMPLGAHFHDTRGTGLANVVAALDAGVRCFDASISGLGGCPNSPRSTGNIATEDLVYMLEAMGLRTGVDLDRLLALADDMHDRLGPTPHHSHLRNSGLPKGFHHVATSHD